MRIQNSSIGMESARSHQASNVTIRRFSIMDYQGTLSSNGNALNSAIQQEDGETGKPSDGQNQNAVNEAGSWQERFMVSSSRITLRSSQSNSLMSLREFTVRYIFDLLFANRSKRLSDWMGENASAGTDTVNNSQGSGNTQNTSGQNGEIPLFTVSMKSLQYSQEVYQYEKEDTSFSTVGTVRTSDGREIHFNVNVGMSREFEQYFRQDIEMASFQMCDPLVINLDTDAAELSDQTFYFDIDADGEKDEIASLGSGSGYLALDKNEDGIINDGSELFGTESGNGFFDLAKYDEDGNGWIDENDAIWSKLKIWCKDENGEDVLYRLADKGVGAICLQNVSTDHTLKGDNGQTKGAIRNTGVFLYENGNAGTVQHVDVAKYNMKA